MLKRVGNPEPETAQICIGEARYPKPFLNQLEFNPPVHENWNIVHTGMLIPEAHQIYVCPDNCMRGVVMTADEMNAGNRFSCVLLEEKDVIHGSIDQVTLEGISDAIRRIPYRPKAVLVFLVCLHHFMGVDSKSIYRKLEERFPDICFMDCWMDPIMMKTGITPEQKERKAMMKPLQPLQKDRSAAIVGDDLPLMDTSTISVFLKKHGYTVRQVQDCSTYEEYLQVGHSSLLITRTSFACWGLKNKAKSMGRPWLYMPVSVSYEEITESMHELSRMLSLPEEDYTEEIARCERMFEKAADVIGDTPIAIDALSHPRPLGLARILIEHGRNVRTVYLDAVSSEEEKDFIWLQEQAPELILSSTNHVTLRRRGLYSNRTGWKDSLMDGGKDQSCCRPDVLAIGPKAAYFEGTEYFVNIIEADGSWGFDGICHVLELMMEAYASPKDTRSIVPRKGLGCDCVL